MNYQKIPGSNCSICSVIIETRNCSAHCANVGAKYTYIVFNMKNKHFIQPSIIMILVLITGILIGVNLDNSPEDNTSDLSPGMRAEPGELQQTISIAHAEEHSHQSIVEQLEAETNARKVLEKTISDLQLQISELGSNLQHSNVTNTPGSASQTQNSSQWFNEEVMLSTGLSEAEIMEIKNQYETTEMEKLYLRDRAIRENWIGTERYTNELSELNNRFDSFRSQTDNNVYETLLFATGQSNRVIIQDVMQNSPASQAGIKTGDYLLQYGDTRIYSAFDLRRAISDGESGEEVKIELSRDGSGLSVYMLRGPMGIRMESTSVQP